ncbi:MAG: hypothetical protein AVDCRST_MAG01-01-4403, partial [uncultured Rubrobacteraceae bacterium]
MMLREWFRGVGAAARARFRRKRTEEVSGARPSEEGTAS